nr:hypothetical protein [uncultured Mediterranean phage uvMED]
MNNLKKYAGLLNEEAPENHFLAYITPSERDMLVKAGGVKTPTESGIFAYPPGEKYGGTNSSGGFNDPTPSSSGSSNNNNNSGNNDYTGSDAGFSNTQSNEDFNKTPVNTNYGNDNNYQDRIMGIPTGVTPPGQPFDQRSDLAKTGDAILDFVKGGGITGSVFKTINNLAENFNKNRRNDFMSTKDIKDYELGTGKNWNPNMVTNVNSDEYNYLKNETNYFDQFNSEDNRDENDPSSFFDNPQDMVSQNIVNNPNPFSQVNNYFKNIGSNLGVSSAYMDTYNDAKTKIANTLNLTSNNNQYGYGNIANDNFARSMTSANPFFDELTNQGLI